MNISAPVAAFAIVLLALGGGALVVGVHDAALRDAGLAVTGAAVLLIALAVLLIVAAYELAVLSRRTAWPGGKRPQCKARVLIAFLVLLLAGTYLFFAGVRSIGGQRWIVVVAALAFVALALVGLGFFGREARVTLPRLGTIALGLVGTTVAAWQFWYQNEVAPVRAGRAVALDADLALAGQNKLMDVVRATIGFEAVTGRSVSVVGSAYTLTGVRVVRCDRRTRVAADALSHLFDKFLLDPQRSRFTADVREQQPGTVLAAGKFAGDGRRLEPKVPYTREFVFFVPRSKYQLLRLRAQLFAIPASFQLSRRALPEYSLADDNRLYGFWHLDNDSWLHDLIYGRERWVVIRYELVSTPGNPKAGVDIRVAARAADPAWTDGRPTLASAAELFAGPLQSDPSEPLAAAELPLEDVVEPGPGDTLPSACKA